MPLASPLRSLPARAGFVPEAGQLAQPSNSPAPATAAGFGPWQLEAVIAEGSWNRVYRASAADRAKPPAANRAGAIAPARFAIKALHERHWQSPLAVSRLRTEATVGRCAMHAHLSPLVSAHVHKPPFYLVMPLLPGANAAAMLRARGKFRVPQALWLTRQIAEGLAALHTLDYVHGDVRPAKIFVGPDGHATLLDLGCAQRVETEPSFDDRPMLGAIESFAPELHVGQPITPRSDVYSLGLAMFQMLAGRLPWRGADVGVIAAWKTSSQTVDVREFAPSVPAAVSRFVRTMMAVEPLRRPGCAREVAEELVRLEIATLGQRISH